uniref:Relaxasome subunit MobC n=1 Tax=uncultured prokaryote TaxID=198431 RepID=A0A0H5QQA9_9ZZZZ|nr:hypothetical protein [uncultured prokaryote]
MSLLEDRLTATKLKMDEFKQARKLADKERRKAYKENEADRERKAFLLGEVVLSRFERGEMDEDEYMGLVDEARMRPRDRILFGIE